MHQPHSHRIKAYLLTIENCHSTYKAFVNSLQQIFKYLQPRLIKIAVVVKQPLHAHVVCFFDCYPKTTIRRLQLKGWYIHASLLPNAKAVENAVNYCYLQDKKHNSSFMVINLGGEKSMIEKRRKRKASEVLKEILNKLEELDERISKIENGKATRKVASKTTHNSNNGYSNQLPITIKLGNKGYLIFLNNYKMVRNTPMTIVNGKQLMLLRNHIDMLLGTAKKRSQVRRIEGFENALEE